MQPKGPMGPWAHAGPKGPAYKLGAWCRSSPTGGIHFQKWVLDFEGMYLSILNMFSSVLGGPIPLWGYPPFSNSRSVPAPAMGQDQKAQVPEAFHSRMLSYHCQAQGSLCEPL